MNNVCKIRNKGNIYEQEESNKMIHYMKYIGFLDPYNWMKALMVALNQEYDIVEMF